ncbi:NAD(P)-dependent oxidoreductase [Acetobacteraceae bacterium KSS8]|uniref:NAD(P)-dependent oxidoreductase n=1 Tax=Endosaccharibacter trunci TaxID=2812733 RepID=A0ABT1W901_9PROT|nr:NAD(P)-dependent oxidoreductase [Acetobacteraceae bacterium KSS8]
MSESKVVGFVGYGAMAKLMAKHIRAAGYTVIAFTPSAKGGEAEDGTRMLSSPRELAAASDVVMVSVPNDDALESSAYGSDGILAGMKQGGLLINTSSVSPRASRRLFEAGSEKGVGVVDAPVSGSTPEAEKGELVVLAGGNDADIARAAPFLDAIGKKTVHAGPPGQGSVLKLVINGIMVSTMAAISEAAGYGVAAGLDRDLLLDTLSGLAVVSPHHQHKIRSAGSGNIDPQFPTWLAHKDLGLLLADAAAHGAPLGTIAAATQLMTLVNQDQARDDYSAVLPTAMMLASTSDD